MARNEEKAQALLNKWTTMKRDYSQGEEAWKWVGRGAVVAGGWCSTRADVEAVTDSITRSQAAEAIPGFGLRRPDRGGEVAS